MSGVPLCGESGVHNAATSTPGCDTAWQVLVQVACWRQMVERAPAYPRALPPFGTALVGTTMTLPSGRVTPLRMSTAWARRLFSFATLNSASL